MSPGYWFTSSRFAVEPGEDEEINPGIYGRQLAAWIRDKLAGEGYTIGEVVLEDWGRCLVIQRSPFMLWVGVGNSVDENSADIPPRETIHWHCFAEAEGGLFKRLFGGKSELDAARNALDSTLKRILEAETSIRFVDGA